MFKEFAPCLFTLYFFLICVAYILSLCNFPYFYCTLLLAPFCAFRYAETPVCIIFSSRNYFLIVSIIASMDYEILIPDFYYQSSTVRSVLSALDAVTVLKQGSVGLNDQNRMKKVHDFYRRQY